MYPFPLKRRILSEKGHLSNTSCATQAVKLIKTGAKRIVLAHLSKENNLPFLAGETTESMLKLCGMEKGEDYLLSVAAPQGNDIIII